MTAPIDIEHLHVQANGVTFHVAAAGPKDAPSVLCLHGFPEGSMSWRPVMQALREVRVFAPDLRGYPGTERPRQGYDVLTLTDDVKELMAALELERPVLVGHDWGGALAWIFAHRYSHLIRHLAVVNCTHPRTLVRAVLHFDDFQTLRIPWVPFFEIPRLPEILLTTTFGRALLYFSFVVREGSRGTMDRTLVRELVARFRQPDDIRPPITYYREMVRTLLLPPLRSRLAAVYRTPITVPTTLVWGERDEALPASVAIKSGADAGCDVDWRPLPGVGHFVSLEAPDELVRELRRVLGQEAGPAPI
jgi:pimeloyl-ACP methyl ester carboxylesterase